MKKREKKSAVTPPFCNVFTNRSIFEYWGTPHSRVVLVQTTLPDRSTCAFRASKVVYVQVQLLLWSGVARVLMLSLSGYLGKHERRWLSPIFLSNFLCGRSRRSKVQCKKLTDRKRRSRRVHLTFPAHSLLSLARPRPRG